MNHVKAYTVALWVFGFFVAIAALIMHTVAAKETEQVWVFHLVRNIEIAVAVACFAVATLRSIASPAAGTATTALSILLAIWFPFGTALFVWWIASVRKQEAPAAAPG